MREYMGNSEALELVELMIVEDGWTYKQAFDEWRWQTGNSLASSMLIYRYLRDKYKDK